MNEELGFLNIVAVKRRKMNKRVSREMFSPFCPRPIGKQRTPESNSLSLKLLCFSSNSQDLPTIHQLETRHALETEIFVLLPSQKINTETQLISDKHRLHITLAAYREHLDFTRHTATVSRAIFLRFPPDIQYLL
jgi:hypothetical protein